MLVVLPFLDPLHVLLGHRQRRSALPERVAVAEALVPEAMVKGFSPKARRREVDVFAFLPSKAICLALRL
jgi:hypothetical protein